MKQKIIDIIERSKEVELICVNPEGFTSHGHVNERLLNYGKFIIKGYSKDEHNYDYSQFSLHLDDDELRLLNICRDQAYINEFELEYFKIKDPEYTFNDLIDVAVQAAKDGFVTIYLLGDSNLIIKGSDSDIFHNIFKNDDEQLFKDCIALINSLYTETFVIETEEDIKKVVEGAKVVMANGVEVTACKRIAHLPAITLCYQPCKDSHIQYLWIEALKGATVTQKSANHKSTSTSTEPVQLDLFD